MTTAPKKMSQNSSPVFQVRCLDGGVPIAAFTLRNVLDPCQFCNANCNVDRINDGWAGRERFALDFTYTTEAINKRLGDVVSDNRVVVRLSAKLKE